MYDVHRFDARKILRRMGIQLKKRWAVLGQKQDGGQLKISETFSGSSLKEDLSIDTSFDPCYFSWDSPFNVIFKAQ